MHRRTSREPSAGHPPEVAGVPRSSRCTLLVGHTSRIRSNRMIRSFSIMISLFASTGTLYAADDAKVLVPTQADVSYGPHTRNVLDFWKAEGDGPRPLLVYIHGGGWIGGDKKQNPAAIRPYLDKGISCASINYRLTGEAPL